MTNRVLTDAELDAVTGGGASVAEQVEACNESIRMFINMVEEYVYGGPSSGPHRPK
jgi:hypothetical protein